eukprot:TRINITY_DN7234_c0_g1_i1.p1 TRINITY_DN7234_c0_g1~~TRINITY_DN7234_c0_g1_i1.p1  ORF type:complete len:327 (-),score=58.73 TRINITY_DN7234_c0_g1_i1:118-1098(-)
MNAEQLQNLQAKLDRIVDSLISRLATPLSESESTISRINEKMAVQVSSGSRQARTGRAQEIYNLISQIERIHKSLQFIETTLSAGQPTASDDGQYSVGMQEKAPSYSQLRIEESHGEYNEPSGYNYDASLDLGVDSDKSDYKGTNAMLYGKFTEAGLTATLPMSNAKTNVHASDDLPIHGDTEVQPWNSKYPIKMKVTIPHQKWFTGENVKMVVELHNQSPKKLQKLECTLVRKSVTRNSDGKTKHKNKDEAVFFREIIPPGFPVPGRRRHRCECAFKLPFNIAPTTGGPNANFETHYVISVRVPVKRHTGPTVDLGPLRVVPYKV